MLLHKHTHLHTPSVRFSRSPLESKTQKLITAYHFFPSTFFSYVGVPRDRGSGKGREGDAGGGETFVIGTQHWVQTLLPPLLFLGLAMHVLWAGKGHREGNEALKHA